MCVTCGVTLAPQASSRSASGYNFLVAPANGQQGTKSVVAAGVLAILLGGLGVHRFYLGYVGVGFAYLGALLAALLLFWLVIPLILPMITGALALVEGILLLTGSFDTDAQGYRLAR